VVPRVGLEPTFPGLRSPAHLQLAGGHYHQAPRSLTRAGRCHIEGEIAKRPPYFGLQLHPEVAPQVSHLRQVPLRTSVKLPHSPQLSPS
jgi:hypothetical protein